ncbi:hypothetical protein F4776DRAFT_676872 [Hypoxylon sp. NC0597]|nr:hypothetical protein F4776DRAFT_676872 [Hypoxylon sp. NC0597]
MRPMEETQRLFNAARLEEKLQQPENQQNALRLLQALTVKEIYAAKRKLDSIEDDLCKLQEANTTRGISNERVENQLGELRKDQEALHLLISKADTITHNTKDDLESLRAKVSDEYFKLTADNVRFSKDIKTLNKQVDRHKEQICTIETVLEDFRSKLPKTQQITELKDAVARLQPLVKSLSEKLETASVLNPDQKKEMMKVIRDQERVRQFLDSFIPKQEDFFQFLEKLPKMNSPTMTYESILQRAIDEGKAGSQLFSRTLSGPQPPIKAVQMLDHYNHFSNSYRMKRPKSDGRFIRQYLKKIDHKAAWLIQMRLQQEYPDLVDILQHAETSNKTDVMIFLNVDKLSWDHVKIIMRRIKGKELFNLLETTEEQESGVSLPCKRSIMEVS